MAEHVEINKQYYYKLFKDYVYNSANECSDLNSKDIIYIKKSNIHGIGLFAKKDINENELITADRKKWNKIRRKKKKMNRSFRTVCLPLYFYCLVYYC